ncbi:hypothetical protein GGI20_006245, partial [Coemansia sp. BCRC 34301]
SPGKPEPEPEPDTQLPSFLFPRRRAAAAAARNREIATLPHYSESQRQSMAASPQSPDSAALADLTISGKEPVELASDGSPHMEANSSSRSSVSSELDVASICANEVQKLLQDEGVRATAENVAVAKCQFIPAADMPLVDGQALASGSRVIQRRALGICAVYMSRTELIEVAEGSTGGVADNGDSRHIAARVPLTSLVRASRLGTDETSLLRAESKCGRFDSATWIEYSPNGGGGQFTDLVNAVLAAVSDNIASGLPEHLYKQAECLRCNWHGYVDHERTFFDLISDSEFTVIPPPAKELQCPKCKRSYLREYYAADEQREDGAVVDFGSSAQNTSVSIWKQPFMTRRNRPNPTPASQPRSAAAEASERRTRHAQHLEAARGALAADVQKLDGIAVHGELPFARVTNAVRLFLQLS